MARTGAGRPRGETEFDKTQSINRWFDENLDRLTDMTAEQLAEELGYSRPNIISMWRTGRTRIPLEKLADLSLLLGVDLTTLLPLWLEQYAEGETATQIKAAASRMVSDDEYRFLLRLRSVTAHRRFKLQRGAEKHLKELLDFDDNQ